MAYFSLFCYNENTIFDPYFFEEDMEKRFKILSIVLFSFGLFFTQFFNTLAAYPDPIYDESLYPKITSVSPISPTKIRMHRDTLEILGENFKNVMLKIGNEHHVPLDSAQGNTNKVTNWSNTKILIPVNYQTGFQTGFSSNIFSVINTKFELLYKDKDGKDASVGYYFNFLLGDTCQSDWDWICPDYGACQPGGTQTRVCVRSDDCQELNNPRPKEMQSCYYAPLCTDDNWSCTGWNTCNLLNHTQTRTCTRNPDCQGGVSRPTTQSCTYTPACTYSSWSCGLWGTCSSSGVQNRTCNKISSCEGGTSSPATTQSCTYVQSCSADTWECGSWGTCSPQGIKTRSCSRTYDCSSVATASPATSEYCQPPKSTYQVPSDNTGIVNQSSIVRATVKLICPISSTRASQGTGTIIDSSGTILTNKHVVEGTLGCLVGFIDSYSDEPYFGNRHIADIYKVSSSIDAAILKLRNPSSANLTSINVSGSNSNNVGLGDILTTYGYPAIFGTKITFTSGDFSGVDGEYLKTTAVIEHGNSGGGAYLKSGAFIGIPTAVIKGDLNSLGYILSINRINSWMSGSTYAYDSGSSNNYSRVSSVLDDIDLSSLDSLGLYISDLEPEVYTLDSRAYTGGNSNRLNFRVNWLVKNKKYAEVFWADSDMCLHWIINEEIAERNFGVTWNYEGTIKEFDSVSEYGYKFCEKLE